MHKKGERGGKAREREREIGVRERDRDRPLAESERQKKNKSIENRDLIVADVINGVVDGEDDVLAGGQQVSVVHDVDEVEQGPVLADENVNCR